MIFRKPFMTQLKQRIFLITCSLLIAITSVVPMAWGAEANTDYIVPAITRVDNSNKPTSLLINKDDPRLTRELPPEIGIIKEITLQKWSDLTSKYHFSDPLISGNRQVFNVHVSYPSGLEGTRGFYKKAELYRILDAETGDIIGGFIESEPGDFDFRDPGKQA